MKLQEFIISYQSSIKVLKVSLETIKTNSFQYKMFTMKSFVSAMFAIILIIAFTHSAEGAMKKPPFNGSMFGKRGTSVGKCIKVVY